MVVANIPKNTRIQNRSIVTICIKEHFNLKNLIRLIRKHKIITSVAVFVKCPALVESARLNDFRVDVGTVDQEDSQAL